MSAWRELSADCSCPSRPCPRKPDALPPSPRRPASALPANLPSRHTAAMQAVDLLTVGDGVRGRRNTPVRATRRTPCGARGAVGAYSSRPGAYVQPSMARRASHLSEPSQQLGCAAPRKSRFLDVRCNAGAATDKPADTVTAADRREGRILLVRLVVPQVVSAIVISAAFLRGTQVGHCRFVRMEVQPSLACLRVA